MLTQVAPEKKWFQDGKFGVFIHWLIVDFRGESSPETDQAGFVAAARQEAAKFTATKYDPKSWARAIKDWGAKYVVLTTKHHTGFALYDCPEARFTARKSSPAKRDLVKEYVDAVRAEGLKVGLYFSLPDRCHPDYFSVVMKDGKTLDWQRSDLARWKRFTDDMIAEIRHLCTAYGKIDLFWFDGDWERTADLWRSHEIVAMINELCPGAVLNNRLRHADLGDYGTPEMVAPILPRSQGPWEFCTTLAYNWCGQDGHRALKAPHELVRIFGDMVSIGGTVLLNMTPDYEGVISEPQLTRMKALGDWIRKHAEAIYGTQAGLPPGLFNGGSTRKGATLYLIVYENSPYELVVKNVVGKVISATHLTTGTPLQHRRLQDYHNADDTKQWLYIKLPEELMEEYATVIKLQFADNKLAIQTPSGETIDWSTPAGT